MDWRDWVANIIGVVGAVILTGYLEQYNYIPQENFFTSIVAIVVLTIVIGTVVNMITGNSEDKTYLDKLRDKDRYRDK